MLLTKFNDFISIGEIARHDALKDSFKIINGQNMDKNSNSNKGELEIMPYIRYRKDGRYEAILSFKGKYYSIYDRQKENLNKKITKKFRELKKESKNNKALETKNQSLTLQEYFNEWLELDKKPFVSKSTLFSINNCFNNHILPKLGKIKLNEITKNNIQIFLNNMPKNRVKEICTTYLKSCITQAYKEEYLSKNPFDLVKIDKKIKSDKGSFNAEQQKTLLNYLKINEPNWYNIILCYLCLGCRRSELYTIKIENIKNGLALIEGTKTKNAVRYIKITPEFEIILKNTISKLPQVDFHWITKKFRNILKTLNIQGSIHTLRHSFITNHYFLNTPAKQVQNWVGHASIQMTLDIYTNINPQIDPKEEKEKLKKLYNNLYYYSE